MDKKKYISPVLEVLETEAEELLALSLIDENANQPGMSREADDLFSDDEW